MSADRPPTAGGIQFEIRLLGPVRAVRLGGEIALGGPQKRAVLALLVLEAGRVVPAGRLVEELWRDDPPQGAATTLRSYISRLRATLGTDAVLDGRGGGYMIIVKPDDVDACRFEQLVGAGQSALREGRAAVAAGRFAGALRLWRGRALADVCDVEALALESARLEELRLAAVEGRIEADIALGRHAQVTGELESLVAEHPVRERLWRLLVLALYRDERQADALAAYQRARRMLAAEVGHGRGHQVISLVDSPRTARGSTSSVNNAPCAGGLPRADVRQASHGGDERSDHRLGLLLARGQVLGRQAAVELPPRGRSACGCGRHDAGHGHRRR